MAVDPQASQRKGPSCIGLVIGLAIVAGIILYAFWPGDDQVRGERDAVLSGSAQEQVTADEFRQAYRENEVAAATRFDDKAITLTGAVAGVRESNSRAVVVSFSTKDGVGVEASVDAEDREKAGALKPGSAATVHCARLLDMLGARVLAECRLR